MEEHEKFTPPYPTPHKSKIKWIKRFTTGWGSWIHTLAESSYKTKIGHVRFPKASLFIINDRELVKDIGIKRHDEFPKHRMQHETLCPLLGESIFTTNGDQWKRQRYQMNPAFAHTHLKRSFGTMQGAVNDLLRTMKGLDHTAPIAIDPLMTHVTADVIFRTILSHNITDEQTADVLEAFNIFQKYAQHTITLHSFGLPDKIFSRQLNKNASRIRGILRPIIKARHDAYHAGTPTEDKDILASLLESTDETGKHFPLDELVNHIAMLFLAGHETTASALTWSLYLLSQCPHLQKEIQAEINAHSKNGEITFETIKHLKTTLNVFQEAMRLYPPVSFYPREAMKECPIGNKTAQKGDVLSISPWLIHRHRKVWKDPDVFDPSRFDDPAQKENIKEHYLPFGLGPRLCIGKGFAIQESVLTLATIIQNFDIKNVEVQVPEPMARLTVRPKHDIKLWLTPTP